MKKKRILITGAAGAVGLETLKELMKSPGYITVRAFDLPIKQVHSALTPFENHVEVISGSIEDRKAVEEAVRDTDLVIHLAAIIPPMADARPDLTGRVNIWGTHLLIEAMKGIVPDAFLLYASSVSVYGDRLEDPWISVEDLPNPGKGDVYAASKITAEKLITESGLRHSIFRLTGIMNPDAAAGRHIDPLMFHMPLDTSFELATTRDAGFALSRTTYHEDDIEGRIFNLAGGAACRISYRDLLSRTFDLLGMDFGRMDENAFATRGFHCGFFRDSRKLDEILHFQRDSVESYLEWIYETIPGWRRGLIRLGKNSALRFMINRSEPLKALRTGNELMIRRFFSRQPRLAPAH